MSQAEPVAHSYVSQGLRLNYVEWGEAGDPPLVLLHGGRDHCRSWDDVVHALPGDWRVIAPDLRGHGDSAASPDGSYSMAAYVYDLAALVEQLGLAGIRIVGHSLGGAIAIRYAGIYPEKVAKLVAIEGLGPSPALLAERARIGMAQRMRDWIEEQHALAARRPRRYRTIEEAVQRMTTANERLAPALARHLTVHGLRRNADGTHSWKYDNGVRSMPPVDFSPEQLHETWSRITCPTLLVHGADSWASNPAEDGRAGHFRNAQVVSVAGAGHWVQHDRFEVFVGLLAGFL